MNDGGWIKLYRKIRDTKFWENKPFSKGQAWIDLLFDVNFKTTKIIHKKKYLQIRPGQLFISQRKYAKKWGWSKTKVRDYFQTLENLDQIQTIKKTTLGTLVVVVNWTLYQSREMLKNHSKDHKKTTKIPLKDHPTTSNIHLVSNTESDKNYKNLKNDKKSTTTESSSSETNLNYIMVLYQKKFPEQRKLYGMAGVVRARDYFDGILEGGHTLEDVKKAINKSTKPAPWDIIKPKKLYTFHPY